VILRYTLLTQKFFFEVYMLHKVIFWIWMSRLFFTNFAPSLIEKSLRRLWHCNDNCTKSILHTYVGLHPWDRQTDGQTDSFTIVGTGSPDCSTTSQLTATLKITSHQSVSLTSLEIYVRTRACTPVYARMRRTEITHLLLNHLCT